MILFAILAGANLFLVVWNPDGSKFARGLSAAACLICLIAIAVGLARGDLK